MSQEFLSLVSSARGGAPEFSSVTRQQCVEATREYAKGEWEAIRLRHCAGSSVSGGSILRALTETADTAVKGVVDFGLYHARNRNAVLSRISICALGGYGREELCPQSDLDICLLYDSQLEPDVKALNEYIVPFLWDIGFRVGYAIYSVSEAIALAIKDPTMFTSFAQARRIVGDNTTFVRLKLLLSERRSQDIDEVFRFVQQRENPEVLPEAHRDLYAPEPDVKESVGGLRDFHAGIWMIMLRYGPLTLDDLYQMGHITSDEHLDAVESRDFLWRVRNEIHYETGKVEDVLSFALQEHMAEAFGYTASRGKGSGASNRKPVERFMQDYYGAARSARKFLKISARICDHQMEMEFGEDTKVARSGVAIHRKQICAGMHDRNWFSQYPARMMEVIWESARRTLPLSPATARRMTHNLRLVGDEFRSNDIVRRFFLAVCNRPLQAGFALRQASDTGLLGAYLPEFGAIHGIVRYKDFHSYPVDEHTLRAVEALGAIPTMEGSVGRSLQKNLDHVHDPYIVVLAILCHDLGKVHGEKHAEEGVEIARTICARIGVTEDEGERVAFLVRHHMLMTHMSMYRDTDDLDIVISFAETMKTADRLRELLLLSYADLTAVGPNVWTEWKGALLLKLYRKAERILQGREPTTEEAYWTHPKIGAVKEYVPNAKDSEVEGHVRSLGARYFFAFSPVEIASHMGCLSKARNTGLASLCANHQETGTSEVVVCTRDRHGLFAELAGSFAAFLVDVRGATLFATEDGYTLDCFTVTDAANLRPLTTRQFEGVEKLLRKVLLEGEDIQAHVDNARRGLFALLPPKVPLRIRVGFDNDSSRTDTVIDIEAGDRMGLLYDIARALTDLEVDFHAARIVTDARRVRDSFYVRMDDNKLEDKESQASVSRELERAIQPMAAAGRKVGAV